MSWRILNPKRLLFLLAPTLLLLATAALAQTETTHIAWWTVDGGGAFSSGGAYALGSTAGQADAGLLSAGDYTLGSGFWGARLATPNGEPQILHYGFDEGLEGWSTGHQGGEYDSAEWSDDSGNPPGSVRLDGSDLGNPDGQPNSWMTKTVSLPATFDLLYFETRAVTDGALRVRLVDGGGTAHTLLDWEVLAGEEWRERTADIAPYAGQTVTLYFEQGDNDVGIEEHRYVDNVILCEQANPRPSVASGAGADCVGAPGGGNATYLPLIVRQTP